MSASMWVTFAMIVWLCLCAGLYVGKALSTRNGGENPLGKAQTALIMAWPVILLAGVVATVLDRDWSNAVILTILLSWVVFTEFELRARLRRVKAAVRGE